ncbi:hypothetical protein [Phreatobacter sp. AB_2022a]|uniref:hypothetical protein n=1 Tax=Phreatobacter sp. AB_2022a TaxID=3003134 RepID=UPI002287254E|nr:hypothetical protein [Phreatobacter sp. AB_2022a]MCZ0738210.1 hypothetical protein [Phreatobacter sp. AB_2022a]
MTTLLTKTLVSGSVLSVVTAAALALLARAEGRGALQPVNATSHWYWGNAAGRVRGADARHTLVGVVTHHAASVFWAGIFQAARRQHPARAPVVDALAVSALAAIVDYGLVPKRLTPGWEKALPRRAVALAYAAMAVAFLATCPPREQGLDRP